MVAGLIAGDLIGGIAGTPAALLGDWKTAHLTRTSVLSMFIVTLVGGFIGCLPGPLIFQIFWKAFPIGDPTRRANAAMLANTHRAAFSSLAALWRSAHSALLQTRCPASCMRGVRLSCVRVCVDYGQINTSVVSILLASADTCFAKSARASK